MSKPSDAVSPPGPKKPMPAQAAEAVRHLQEEARRVAREHNLFVLVQATANDGYECQTAAVGNVQSPYVLSSWMVGFYKIVNAVHAMGPEMAAMIGAIEGKRVAGGHGPCMALQSYKTMAGIMADREAHEEGLH